MRQRPQLLHHAVLRAAHRPDPVAGVVGPELHRHRPFQHRANALVHRLGRGPLRVPDRGRDLQNVAARHRPASCRRAGTRSRRKHTPPLPGQAAGRAEGRPRRVRLRQSRPRDIDRAPLVGRRTAGLGGRSGDKAGPFEIVTVVRTCREMEWARTILGNWAEAPAASGPSDPARREIACIEQAIRGMDDAVIEKHGGLQGCLERIVELKDLLRSASAHQTSGVDGHENALPTGTSAPAHVVGRLPVAPRPPERRRRSGTCGRGWERPPLRDAWYGIGEGRHGHAHAILRRGSLPTSDPSRKGVQRRCGAADHPVRRPSSRCVCATAEDRARTRGERQTVGCRERRAMSRRFGSPETLGCGCQRRLKKLQTWRVKMLHPAEVTSL